MVRKKENWHQTVFLLWKGARIQEWCMPAIFFQFQMQNQGLKLLLAIKLFHVPPGKISGKEGEKGQKSKNQNTLLSSLLETSAVYHLLSENTAEPSMCVYKSHTPDGIAFYFGSLVSCFSIT